MRWCDAPPRRCVMMHAYVPGAQEEHACARALPIALAAAAARQAQGPRPALPLPVPMLVPPAASACRDTRGLQLACLFTFEREWGGPAGAVHGLRGARCQPAECPTPTCARW